MLSTFKKWKEATTKFGQQPRDFEPHFESFIEQTNLSDDDQLIANLFEIISDCAENESFKCYPLPPEGFVVQDRRTNAALWLELESQKYFVLEYISTKFMSGISCTDLWARYKYYEEE